MHVVMVILHMQVSLMCALRWHADGIGCDVGVVYGNITEMLGVDIGDERCCRLTDRHGLC